MPFKFNKPKDVFVREKFSEIAKRYDIFNDIITLGLHRLWKKQVARLALRNNPSIVLDACCGTGDIAKNISRMSRNKNIRIIGADFSQEMLDIASSDNSNVIQWDNMNMSESTYPDDYFDAVTIGFGLRNLKDHAAGLKEFHRIIKPRGKLVILDMGKVTTPVLSGLYNFFFFKAVPFIGKILQPGQDMFEYFPNSTLDYPSPKKLKKMLEDNGFYKVNIYSKAFGSVVIHSCRKQ